VARGWHALWGVITDVYAGTDGELRGHWQAGLPDPQSHGLPTVRGRRLDPAALAVLDVLLSGVSAGEALADTGRTPQPEPNLYAGPVVTTLSPRIVRLLPAVAPQALSQVAEDWSRSDEMAGTDPGAVQAWLAEMQGFLREQVGHGRLLMVWNCL
jgi:hypothetical protein